MTSFLFDGEGFEFSHLQRMAQLNGQRLSLKQQQELLEVQKQLLDEAKRQASQAEELKKQSLAKANAACGPACPHCGGNLPSDAKTMLYRKCRHCAGDLFWFSGSVYGDRETFEEIEHKAALMATQAAASAEKARASAELKSLRDFLSKLERRDRPGAAVSAGMPTVITRAELEAHHSGLTFLVRAQLQNDSYNIIKSLRIVFLSDSQSPASVTWRGSLGPLDKAEVTFDVDSKTMSSGGSLWVAVASSVDGQEWEQSLKEAHRQSQGVIDLRVRPPKQAEGFSSRTSKAITLPCPRCGNPIELSSAVPGVPVTCEGCGISLRTKSKSS
jgi:hypothetical protein